MGSGRIGAGLGQLRGGYPVSILLDMGSGTGDGVAQMLQEALDVLGASQADLARATGRSPTAVGLWFTDTRKRSTTLHTIVGGLNSIAAARGFVRRWTVADLLGEGAPPVPTPEQVGPPPGALPVETIEMPSYGPVPCGTPLIMGDYVEMITLERSRELDAVGSGCYALVADGDSMVGWDIHDGDTIIVDPEADWRDGAVVIASVNGGVVCKQFRIYRDGTRALEAGSTDYPPILLRPQDQVQSHGVVVLILPRPRHPNRRGGFR